jgi:hypothetical protein
LGSIVATKRIWINHLPQDLLQFQPMPQPYPHMGMASR